MAADATVATAAGFELDLEPAHASAVPHGLEPVEMSSFLDLGASTTTKPKPVLDKKFDKPIPVNYRCPLDGLPDREGQVEPDLNGFSHMSISGSAQFTPAGLTWLFTHLAKEPATVVIVDLREESHSFASDRPLTWHAKFNWANFGRERDWIIQDEVTRTATLTCDQFDFFEEIKSQANPTGVTVPHRTTPFIKNCQGLTEQELVERAGARYLRCPVTDHARPKDDMVDLFVSVVRQLHSTYHFHLHCRAGRGRTTMFMCVYDMLLNSRNVPFSDIAKRQSLLPKDGYDLMHVPAGGWKKEPMGDRAQFLHTFHEYAKEYPMEHPDAIPWSEWFQKQT